MTEHPDAHRIDERAGLLPEEQAVGSDDPQAQAEVILADSDARTEDPEGTRDDSSQTPDARQSDGAGPGSSTSAP